MEASIPNSKAKSEKIKVRRFDIFKADLEPVVGSEQGGTRPVLAVQNDDGNKESPTTIVACITKRKTKAGIKTHFYLGKNYGLLEESIVLLEQLRTIDKSRLKEKIGHIDDPFIQDRIDECILESFGIKFRK